MSTLLSYRIACIQHRRRQELLRCRWKFNWLLHFFRSSNRINRRLYRNCRYV